MEIDFEKVKRRINARVRVTEELIRLFNSNAYAKALKQDFDSEELTLEEVLMSIIRSQEQTIQSLKSDLSVANAKDK